MIFKTFLFSVSLTHQLEMDKITQETVEPGFIIPPNNIGRIFCLTVDTEVYLQLKYYARSSMYVV